MSDFSIFVRKLSFPSGQPRRVCTDNATHFSFSAPSTVLRAICGMAAVYHAVPQMQWDFAAIWRALRPCLQRPRAGARIGDEVRPRPPPAATNNRDVKLFMRRSA